MNTDTMLVALKVDLGITTTAYDERLTQILNSATKYIEAEGITLEKHIIRADGGEIDDICGDRDYQHRQGGKDELPRLFDAVISVIARNEKDKHRKEHRSVVGKGMEAHKGDAGIV